MDYISRRIHNVKDMDILAKAHERGHNILLKGPTGSAKTMVSQEYARINNYPVEKIPCSMSAGPDSLFGKYVPKENERFFEWMDGLVTALLRREGRKVLILDEINMMDPRVAATMFSLLDSNKELILLDHSERLRSEDTLIIGTMNPGYRGTRQLNQALANRFPITLRWDYDRKVERKICPSPKLLQVVKKLRDMEDRQELNAPFSTNMILEFMQNHRDFGFDFAASMAANKYPSDEEQEAVNSVFMTNSHGITQELNAAQRRKDNPRPKKISKNDVYNWPSV